MKKIKYVLLIMLIVGFIIPMNIKEINAASFSISGPSSVSPGQSFSITVSASGGEGSFLVSASGGASVTGKNPVWSNESTTITAPSSGTFTVTVSCTSFADDNATEVNLGSKSKNITVNAPATGGSTTTPNNKPSTNTPPTPETPVEDTRSKDNTLSGLTVSEGTLTPAFNKDVAEYSVNVDSKVTKLTIGASASDAKATVSGAGEKDVVPGENIFEVVVTAENKSTKKYTVKVNVDETPTVFQEYNKNKLGVVKNLRDVVAPAGFEETTVKINDEDVKAWANGNMNKTIVYMVNENNEKNFYLYEDGKIVSLFKPIALLGRNVYIVDIASNQQKIEGLKYQEVTIDGNVMMGWTFENKMFTNYSLISVMDEKGEMIYYQYENTENTMQLYDGGAPITMQEYDNAKKYETYTMIAVVVATVLAGAVGAVTMFCIKYKKANMKIVDMVTKK